MASWGAPEQCLEAPLKDIQLLLATSGAFCGLDAKGRCFCWGDEKLGGNGTAENVTAVAATLGAFAALKEDGSVTAWGHPLQGGEQLDLTEDSKTYNKTYNLTQLNIIT